MGEPELLALYDESRPAWNADGPRPVRTHVWHPAPARPERLDRSGRSGSPDATGPAGLVVLSHGSGGSSADLAWLAEALSADGFRVAAVDHHRNTYPDDLQLEGFSFWWERAADLSYVVDHLTAADRIEPAAVIGHSLGGFTAACVLGARIDADRFGRLYAGEPVLPVPPSHPGRADFATEMAELIERYGRNTLQARALADYRDPRFVAGVLLAPAICTILDDTSLAAIRRPVLVRWGDADDVEPQETNGVRCTRLIPGADGRSLGVRVGHHEFEGHVESGAPVRAALVAEILPFLREHVRGHVRDRR